MFTELASLLKKGDALVLTVTRESDTTLRVNVIPKLFTLDGEHGSDRKALATPLTVTGTVEELDSPEFPQTLTRFASSALDLRQTIDDVEAAHQAAKDAKLKKPEKTVAKTPEKTEPRPETKTEKPSAEEQTASLL